MSHGEAQGARGQVRNGRQEVDQGPRRTHSDRSLHVQREVLPRSEEVRSCRTTQSGLSLWAARRTPLRRRASETGKGKQEDVTRCRQESSGCSDLSPPRARRLLILMPLKPLKKRRTKNRLIARRERIEARRASKGLTPSKPLYDTRIDHPGSQKNIGVRILEALYRGK